MIHLPDYYKSLPRDHSRKYPSIRIFKADWMEAFTHVHPIVPALLWVPVVLYCIWLSGNLGVTWERTSLLTAFGFFFWTFSEYLLHRFAFHYRASSALGKRFCFLMHGIHHADPVDPSRLVMPPFPAVVFSVLFFGLFRLVLGELYVYPMFSGFILGYLAYDYTHFAVHHFNPKTRIGRWIKQHHMLHHYVAPESRWGVSTPLWDYVFGTWTTKAQMQDFSATSESDPKKC